MEIQFGSLNKIVIALNGEMKIISRKGVLNILNSIYKLPKIEYPNQDGFGRIFFNVYETGV